MFVFYFFWAIIYVIFPLIKFNINYVHVEEPGFKGFDILDTGEFEDNNFENVIEREQSPVPEENFELYKKNVEIHDQNQEKIVSNFIKLIHKG